MKRLVTLSLAAALLANSACHMFSKKKNPAAPKESPAKQGEMAKQYRQNE